MCGIAGFWQSKAISEAPSDVLARMAGTLKHRGPDDAGTFYDGMAGVGLAFRRLSIIDLSPQGHQPMASRSGRYTIIFNGEVYNFEEIRAELRETDWRGHSDTEVMLAAIERWGPEGAVSRFVGMFALALWDREEQKLHLVRDRLGIKPLYYGYVRGNFVFASELKAIAEFPGFEGTIDRNALALYMRLAYVPAPHSIYQGIYKLKPGHILSLRAGAEPEVRCYWSATEIAQEGIEHQAQLSDQDAIAQLEEKLSTAARFFRADSTPPQWSLSCRRRAAGR
jgi:asparagine synthase (glutamine-hydrolysing)